MAADKDSLMDLKSELNALKTDLDDGLPAEEQDMSNDMLDLKRRMDKADQEMRAMTEAMKSTLLDVRALMQDMDNPFNMLRDMGVDKLVNKAVETVEDEVNKQKREDAKKRMADGGKDSSSPVTTQLAGSATSAPASAGLSAATGQPTASSLPQMDPQYSAHAPQGGAPQVSAPASGYGGSQSSQGPASGYGGSQPSQGSASAHGPGSSYGGAMSSIEENVQSLMKRVIVTEQAVPMILKRVSRTEEAVGELNDTVLELIDNLKGERRRTRREMPRDHDRFSFELGADESKKPGEVYYEAYVSLVADYLVLRFGEKGAEEILLEGMYKGWASPRVVRDIMDHTATNYKVKDKRSIPLPLGIGQMNNDLEDKILLTSLLKNLDKPVAEWTEPTHLFLLLALVTRARENKMNRAES
ncbi:MAG: hypothetical protein ABIJ47_01670 [Candidatus Bathyarchaeota archaeon]